MNTDIGYDHILYPDEYYHYTARKSYTMNNHSHSLLEINYMSHGSSVYFVDGEKVVLRVKNLLVIRSQLPHRLSYRAGDQKTFSILGTAFSGRKREYGTTSFRDLLRSSDVVAQFWENMGNYLLVRNGSPAVHTLEQLISECDSLADPIYINLLINKLLLEIARLSQNLYSNSYDHIEEIKRIIHKNFYSIQSIQDIAGEVCLNKTYIQRLFKQQEGCTILQYLTNYRMNRAATLLRDSDVSIGEIDSHIGLNSRHNFYLLFHKAFGMSPSEYRKQHRKKKLEQL